MIRHEKNGGYGAAIKTCFEAAIKQDADIMVTLDADGQHNPNDIPFLIQEMLNSRSDVVIGSRFVNGNGKNQQIPAYRKFGMKVLDTATNVGTGMNVSDTQSGFRAYSKKAFKCIRLTDLDMGAGSEILIKAAENGLKIKEVPIKIRYDLENTSSQHPLAHGLKVLNNIIRLVSQKRPLLFFCLPGFLLVSIGTIFGFMLLTIFNMTRNLQVEYGIGTFLFVMVGLTLISTGLMLYSIQTVRTYKER